jgi:hypothetical protein
MKVFISWSGHESRRVAKIVKSWLKETVFVDEEFEPFMSEHDIPAGADWHSTIKQQLTDCKCAIICLTPMNITAPWINFEGGAISITKDKLAIPLLIDIERTRVNGPFQHLQSICVQNCDEVEKLILDLKQQGGFKTPSERHLPELMPTFFKKLTTDLDTALITVRENYDNTGFVIYPEQVTSVKKGKVFIGAPMASLQNKDEYTRMRENVLKIRDSIVANTGASEVYCPCEHIRSRGQFDDARRAIHEDFKILKESEHYVFLYPEKTASSVLLEMGYAIALSKKTTIFTRRRTELPFMLRKADESIEKLRIVQYQSIDKLLDRIKSEGKSFHA